MTSTPGGPHGRRLLVLGGREFRTRKSHRLGWHQKQLREAAQAKNVDIRFADYESLAAGLNTDQATGAGHRIHAVCDDGIGSPPTIESLDQFTSVLTRTMPSGTLEQITFRLAMLHSLVDRQRNAGLAPTIINPPSALELAIDKYATLARVARLGIPIPSTVVTQSRDAAMEAFDVLGGDCVIKPLFGGEGRGVMRVKDPELAWTVASTLEKVGAVMYIQRFVPPGQRDLRLLVIGQQMHAIERTSSNDFRTNQRSGGTCKLVTLLDWHRDLANRICEEFQLRIAAIDLLPDGLPATDGPSGYVLLEVNAIPGWRGAQQVVAESIASQIIDVAVSA